MPNCSPNFPVALPADCLGTLAGIVVRRELQARRREAVWAALQITDYLAGQLVTEPAGQSGVLSSMAPLTDDEAAEVMATLSAVNPAASLDKAKVLLLVKWLAELIPLLLG